MTCMIVAKLSSYDVETFRVLQMMRSFFFGFASSNGIFNQAVWTMETTAIGIGEIMQWMPQSQLSGVQNSSTSWGVSKMTGWWF